VVTTGRGEANRKKVVVLDFRAQDGHGIDARGAPPAQSHRPRTRRPTRLCEARGKTLAGNAEGPQEIRCGPLLIQSLPQF
jgi:hypothetical protein